jgi:hypothetical protein
MSEEVKKEIQEPSDDVSKSMKEPVNYFGGILIILFCLVCVVRHPADTRCTRMDAVHQVLFMQGAWLES